MRPINFKKVLLLSFSLGLLLLLLPGCLDDDLSVCGASIRFTYTRNVDGVDKFSQEVNKVNLYVFGSDSLFVGEYVEEGSRLHSNYSMPLNLMGGTYHLIAWGNLIGDDFDLPVFISGKTHINEAMLSLKRNADNTVTKQPEHLYYGSLRAEIEPDLQSNQFFTIDMMKDSKSIQVTSVGLPVNLPSRSGTLGFDCRIISRNGDYKFDNSITGNDRLHYIPRSSVDSSKSLVSEFVTLRELRNNATNSRLIINQYTDSGAIEKEILNMGLVDEILLPALITGDLELEDEFKVKLEFDYTNATVSINVNGWQSGKTDWEL